VKWFSNLQTSTKLISSFMVIALLLACVGFLSLVNLNRFQSMIAETYEDTQAIDAISQAQLSYLRTRLSIRDVELLANTSQEKDRIVASAMEEMGKVDAEIATYKEMNPTEEELRTLAKFEEKWPAYKDAYNELVQLSYANRFDAYQERLATFDELGVELRSVLTEIIEINIAKAEHSNAESQSIVAASRTTTIVIVLVAVLVSLLMGYGIARLIARPLQQVVALVGKVASGDLRETSPIDTLDEVGRLARAVNDMIANLRGIIRQVGASAHSVAAAAQQISAGTEEIASSSSDQANAVSTMNELMKELTAAIHAVANNAEQAAELTNDTANTARDGGAIVRQAIEGMNRVNEQMQLLVNDSNRIGDIIEVIDDIAEQTNLLALNAAIEAARAGEQGRGFAVVADEVRKLAERSGEATKQISSIIKGMQSNTQSSFQAVSAGVALTERTGEAFSRIVERVNDSSDKVGEIAAASEEQAAQSSEAMTSVATIAAASEEAAAAAEQTAASSQALARLAEELNESVAMFKTEV